MDFKKIANIFIVAFTLLNLYLIYGILERKDIQHTSSPETTHNILANMKEMNIVLPDLTGTEIDAKQIYSIQANADPLLEEKMKESDFYTGTIDEEGVYYTSFPSNPIQLEGNPVDGFTNKDYEIIQEYIQSEEVMYGKEYSGIQYDENGRRFVLYQYVDGIPIVDGTSEISLFVNEEGEIFSYQQTYAGPVTRQGSALNLIDGKRAIELLFINNEIREGFEIEKPILTYQRALHLEDLSMYSPVWSMDVIRSSDRDNFRVDAVNGTIIRHQAVNKPDNPKNEIEENEEENTDETDE